MFSAIEICNNLNRLCLMTFNRLSFLHSRLPLLWVPIWMLLDKLWLQPCACKTLVPKKSSVTTSPKLNLGMLISSSLLLYSSHLIWIFVSVSSELLLNPVVIARTPATEGKAQEKVLIEASINSIRVSVCVKQADEVEQILAKKFMRFLSQRAENFIVLRRKPVKVRWRLFFCFGPNAHFWPPPFLICKRDTIFLSSSLTSTLSWCISTS